MAIVIVIGGLRVALGWLGKWKGLWAAEYVCCEPVWQTRRHPNKKARDEPGLFMLTTLVIATKYY